VNDDLTLALTLGVPLLVCAAAFAASLRGARATVPVLLLAATGVSLAGLVILPSMRRATLAREAAFSQFSPLGLYGVELSVQTDALGNFLAVPCLVASVVGWARGYGMPWRDPWARLVPAGRTGVDAAMLVALAGGTWALVAGDLVSVVLGSGALLVATALALRLAGAADPARWRLVVAGGFSLCLLVCMLLLGKVNGSFAAAQLASVSFSDASLAGLVVVAYGVGNAVPFHGWSLRLARQPLMPAVAAVGSALSLSLVDVAFVTTGGELAGAWRGILTSLGLVAIGGAVIVAWGHAHPRVRLAALSGGRTGLGLLAIASGAPATMSALALLHGVSATGTALLWVAAPGGSGTLRTVLAATGTRLARLERTARLPLQYDPAQAPARGLGYGGLPFVRPAGYPGALPHHEAQAPARGGLSLRAPLQDRAGLVDLRLDAWRSAGPWLVVLVVATAAGLPGTIGGLAADTYLSALAASSDAGWWLRIAALSLDTATIGAGGAVLDAWITAALATRMARARPGVGRALAGGDRTRPGGWAPPERDSWRGATTPGDVVRETVPWLVAAVGIAAVVAPALLPATFVEPWFAAVSVVMAGTSSPPRLVDALRIASPDRIVLTIAAAIALYRTQRGEEMLPAPARALLGVAVLLTNPVAVLGRRAIRSGSGRCLAMARVLAARATHATAIARLVEERYYTAVAVVVAVLLLYSVGR
jgi:hypothetical protein